MHNYKNCPCKLICNCSSRITLYIWGQCWLQWVILISRHMWGSAGYIASPAITHFRHDGESSKMPKLFILVEHT